MSRPAPPFLPQPPFSRSCRWLANAETRDFDLAVFHIGNDSNFSCAQCSHVFHSPGIKWELLRNLSFSPYWEGAAARYRYFMYADDDLQMDACQLNKFFRTVEQVGTGAWPCPM